MADPTYTYEGPLPGAGQYGQYANSVNQAYQTAQQQITDQRNQFLTQSGLVGNYDSTGKYTGFSVNPNAPTGGYQQMNMGNAMQGEADQAGLAAVGFKGGVANQIGENAQASYSAHAKAFADQVASTDSGLNAQEQANTTNQQNQLLSGLVNDITQAIQSGTFNPADYTGITIGGHPVDVSQITQGLGLQTTNNPGSTFKPPAGGTNAQGDAAHPYYAAWMSAHPGSKMTLAQWKAAGSPGRPNGKWNGH